MKKNHTYRPFSGVLVALLIAACSEDSQITEPVAMTQPVAVKTLTLSNQPWSYRVESFGQLNVADTVNIGVESPGTITALNLTEGQPVKAGQLLFALDDKKQQLRYQQAKANVAEASAQLAQSQKTLGRFEALRADGAASEDQLLLAKTGFETAVARLQQTHAALDIASAELAERRLLSPVDGVVERESVEIGQYIQPGQTPVVIQADGALQVSAYVTEYEVVAITVGQTATVTVAGTEFQALIESIGHTAKPGTGNYQIKLRILDGASHLREGMSARVQLPITSSREVLLVPRTAVVDRQRKRVVFVVKEGLARIRDVQFGLPDQNLLPVVSGLVAGEQLILTPLQSITDGVAVIPEQGE